VLAAGGRTAYRIVLPHAPSPSQRFAAGELRRFFRAMTGATLRIVTDRARAVPHEILVGDNARLRELGIAVDWAALGDEGFLLRTAGTRLIIAGSRVRGTLYGVYGLLEDHWGCRWYTASVSRIPKRRRVALPRVDRTWVPRLEYRESYWTEGFDADWAARNRQNSARSRLDEKHGGKIVYEGFVHTMCRWVPETLFKTHPEYFALRGGRRHGGLAQRCLTHPAVLRITIENVRKALRQHPEANIVSVSQNDNGEYCECPPCRALDRREGSHAGTMLTFVNKVAEALEREFPHVAFDTLAYQYTRKPPKRVRPRHNVIVRLCTIECCFSHPLEGCPEATNTSLVRDLKGWSRLTRRVYIWDYTTDFVHYLLPFPDLDVLDKNVRTLIRYGAAGIFEQGNYSKGGGGAQSELKVWVLARLLVDPKLKVDALIREFHRGVYGPAAGPVLAATNLLRRSIRKSREHVRIFDGPDRGFLAPPVLRACDRLLDGAEKLAKRSKDAGLRSRVERARMPVWYAMCAQAVEGPAILGPVVARLKAAIRRQGITNTTEWRPLKLDMSRLDLAPVRWPVVPAVPGTIVVEDHIFKLWGGKHPCELAADASAGDGAAVRQPGECTWSNFEWDLPTTGPKGRFLCRARIRVDKRGDKGPAFTVGVYDLDPRGTVGEMRVSAKDVPDSEYHWYDLCTLTIGKGRYAVVSPAGNAKNIASIWTDRFELVPVRS